MGIITDDIPKYRKKRKSSVSNSKEKSKHKHEYEECLLIDKNEHPHRAIYCKVCGKIKNVYFFEFDGSILMADDKIYKKYDNLKRFNVDSVWQKYISVK